MGGATAAAIAGRTIVGWLMSPDANRRLVACASYLVQIAGTVMLLLAAGSNVPLLIVGILLFGAGIGNATSLPPMIAQAEFSSAESPRVVALIVALAQASYAFAPAIFGLILAASPRGHDMPGSATLFFVAAIAIQALAIAAFLIGRWR
jgi:MFS family permease